MAQRGVRVMSEGVCAICGEKLMNYDDEEDEDILEDLIVFSDRFLHCRSNLQVY